MTAAAGNLVCHGEHRHPAKSRGADLARQFRPSCSGSSSRQGTEAQLIQDEASIEKQALCITSGQPLVVRPMTSLRPAG